MDAARRAKVGRRALVVLVLVSGVVLFNTLNKRVGLIGSKGQAATSASAEALAMAMTQLHDYQQAIRRLEEQGEPRAARLDGYLVEGGRDPLVSLLRKEPPAEPKEPVSTAAPTSQPTGAPRLPQVTVQGIILGKRPQAIIDRRLYGVGETVLGAKIVEITREGVILEIRGRRMVASPAAPTTQPKKTGGVQ